MFSEKAFADCATNGFRGDIEERGELVDAEICVLWEVIKDNELHRVPFLHEDLKDA